MFELITRFAGNLEKVSFLTYPIAVFLGLMAGMAALTCFMPLVPAIAGFIVGGQISRKRLVTVPLLIMAGSVVTLVVLGVIVSLVGLTLQKSLGQYWMYLSGGVCVVIGLFVLGAIKVPTKARMPEIKGKGFLAPFVFGIVMGGVLGFGSSCCLPVLPVVLTYAAIQGRPVHGALILGSFAIGQSIPIFAIGLFSNLMNRLLQPWVVYVRWVAGAAILVVGIYLIFGR